ncbi:hypothetical protein CYLTODRAFT_229083 [Cylindrobasidium torrendii FP15055 ss-10]|uniref:F-box domain-containing protein n=1 Tax=Cylindrobasidium torrendii FP15055 ss-10 TaxID=1314674 RepID=A0A0D7BIG6_9AGAR|nr:hypothetical protein CYLTODRAFT_229083 [Cylindrobasidium torrendii FP15055 ss-10]
MSSHQHHLPQLPQEVIDAVVDHVAANNDESLLPLLQSHSRFGQSVRRHLYRDVIVHLEANGPRIELDSDARLFFQQLMPNAKANHSIHPSVVKKVTVYLAIDNERTSVAWDQLTRGFSLLPHLDTVRLDFVEGEDLDDGLIAGLVSFIPQNVKKLQFQTLTFTPPAFVRLLSHYPALHTVETVYCESLDDISAASGVHALPAQTLVIHNMDTQLEWDVDSPILRDAFDNVRALRVTRTDEEDLANMLEMYPDICELQCEISTEDWEDGVPLEVGRLRLMGIDVRQSLQHLVGVLRRSENVAWQHVVVHVDIAESQHVSGENALPDLADALGQHGVHSLCVADRGRATSSDAAVCQKMIMESMRGKKKVVGSVKVISTPDPHMPMNYGVEKYFQYSSD